MKTCNTCGIELTKENSYTSNNLLCKKCHRLYQIEIYYKNHEKELERQKAYSKTDKGRLRSSKNSHKMYMLYPEKWRARAKLRYAVITGKIIKPEFCQKESRTDVNCDNSSIEAHHYLGYEGEHWKDIKWLCTFHHGEAHRKYKEESFRILNLN